MLKVSVSKQPRLYKKPSAKSLIQRDASFREFEVPYTPNLAIKKFTFQQKHVKAGQKKLPPVAATTERNDIKDRLAYKSH